MVERTGATKIEIHSPTWLSEFKIHLPFGRFGIASGGSLWPVTQRMSTARLAAQGIVTGIQDAMNLA